MAQARRQVRDVPDGKGRQAVYNRVHAREGAIRTRLRVALVGARRCADGAPRSLRNRAEGRKVARARASGRRAADLCARCRLALVRLWRDGLYRPRESVAAYVGFRQGDQTVRKRSGGRNHEVLPRLQGGARLPRRGCLGRESRAGTPREVLQRKTCAMGDGRQPGLHRRVEGLHWRREADGGNQRRRTLLFRDRSGHDVRTVGRELR